MALTVEEQRALAFNLQRERRLQYCEIRKAHLRGSDAAKKELTDRMIAVTRDQNAEARSKVKYSERIDDKLENGCSRAIVN